MIPKIDGYELEHVIGSGGHAVVWAARHRATGEKVAVKWLPSSTMRDESRARAEAALLASLDHPHLIQLRSYLVGANGCALVMEYASGGSLASLLRRRTRLTPPEVVAALSPIASALSYAHREGVMHCDVSAANILFDADGHPKLADLGMARLARLARPATEATEQSSPTDVLGTPAYLDPVVAGGSAPVVAGDVFALGAIALHALTGLGPWQRTQTDSVDAVLTRAAAADIVDLDSALADTPPELAAPIRRALEIQPYRRGTATEFALDLRAGMSPRSVVVGAGRVGHVGRVGRGSGADASGQRDHVEVDLTRLVRRAPDIAAARATEPTTARRRLRFPHRPARAQRSVSTYRARHRVCGSGAGSASAAAVRTRRVRRFRPSVLIGCVAAVLAAVVGASGLALARTSNPAAARRPPAIPAVRHTSIADRPSTASDDLAAAAATTAAATTAAAATAAAATAVTLLRELDARRAAAYAVGKPDLLRAVYGAADLLALDTVRMRATVPAGCGLAGLSTAYTDLRVLSASADELQLAVTATVEGADLNCPGRPPAALAPGAPAKLRIVLQRGTDGFRMVEERRLT